MVSRETNVQYYKKLLKEWNQRINLTSRNEWHNIEAHIHDAKQLTDYLESEDTIIDIGSGNGLPGLILAIYGYKTTLIDLNSRKTSFLRVAAGQMSLDCKIENRDVQENKSFFSVMTSKAVAPIKTLLEWTSSPHQKESRYLFLKGKNFVEEIQNAYEKFMFSFAIHPSKSNNTHAIIELWNATER